MISKNIIPTIQKSQEEHFGHLENGLTVKGMHRSNKTLVSTKGKVLSTLLGFTMEKSLLKHQGRDLWLALPSSLSENLI